MTVEYIKFKNIKPGMLLQFKPTIFAYLSGTRYLPLTYRYPIDKTEVENHRPKGTLQADSMFLVLHVKRNSIISIWDGREIEIICPVDLVKIA